MDPTYALEIYCEIPYCNFLGKCKGIVTEWWPVRGTLDVICVGDLHV